MNTDPSTNDSESPAPELVRDQAVRDGMVSNADARTEEATPDQAIPARPASGSTVAEGAGVSPAAMSAVTLNWLDPKYVTQQRLVSLLVFSVIGVGVIIGTATLLWMAEWWVVRVATLAVDLLLIGLMVFFGFFWPRISYNNIRWCYSDVGLEVWRGVLWRHRIAIPVSRVQHVDVSQGPIERMFGIGTLTVYTAGTHHSEVSIEGFNHELALELRDQLIARKEATDVL